MFPLSVGVAVGRERSWKSRAGFGEGVCWELGLRRAETYGLLKIMCSLEVEGMGCHQEALLFYAPSQPRPRPGLSLPWPHPLGRKTSLCVSNLGLQGPSHTEWVRCSGQPGQAFEDLGPHVSPNADVGLVPCSPWHTEPPFLPSRVEMGSEGEGGWAMLSNAPPALKS